VDRVFVNSLGDGFVTASGRPFFPWGWNYVGPVARDPIATGVVVPEDYWYDHFDVIDRVLGIHADYFGSTACRFHLQLGSFMSSPTAVNQAAVTQYRRLLDTAEKRGIYLDITGCNAYVSTATPAWYDALSEPDRWAVMATYWAALAKASVDSAAVMCFNLKNEPQVWTVASAKAESYYSCPFAGYRFIERINVDAHDPRDGHLRTGREIAASWIREMASAIRAVYPRALVTWGGTAPAMLIEGAGFDPVSLGDHVDFFTYHTYPRGNGDGKGTLDAEAANVERLASHGKPLVIEETFILRDSIADQSSFLHQIKRNVAGVFHTGAGDLPNEEILANRPTPQELEVTVPYQRLQLRMRDAMIRPLSRPVRSGRTVSPRQDH
jgi:hypothetical protein